MDDAGTRFLPSGVRRGRYTQLLQHHFSGEDHASITLMVRTMPRESPHSQPPGTQGTVVSLLTHHFFPFWKRLPWNLIPGKGQSLRAPFQDTELHFQPCAVLPVPKALSAVGIRSSQARDKAGTGGSDG